MTKKGGGGEVGQHPASLTLVKSAGEVASTSSARTFSVTRSSLSRYQGKGGGAADSKSYLGEERVVGGKRLLGPHLLCDQVHLVM
jgi:hypothetical protein